MTGVQKFQATITSKKKKKKSWAQSNCKALSLNSKLAIWLDTQEATINL